MVDRIALSPPSSRGADQTDSKPWRFRDPLRPQIPAYCFCSCSIFSNFLTFGATTTRQYP